MGAFSMEQLNLEPEYHKQKEKINNALSHLQETDILIMKANYPELYKQLLDIASVL